jgi:multidrug resistance efflux pump
LVWNVTDGETWINYTAFIVMTSSGIKTLLNFNPLIKFDGYYLLSDYVEIPNLRKKSWRYVGNLIERMFRLPPSMSEEFSAREKRIFFAYGVVAGFGTFTLLGYVIVTMGGYLVENGQPMALLLSSGFLSMKFRRKFRKLFGKPSDPDLDDGDDFDPFQSTLATAPAGSALAPAYAAGGLRQAPAESVLSREPAETMQSPESAESTPEPDPAESPITPAPAEHKKKKKKSRRWSWWRPILWAALFAAVAAGLFYGRMELRIPGPCVVLPRENADVRSMADGILEDIFVDEGYEVKTGDVIARIDDRDLLAELRKTESSIKETQANLKKLETGPTDGEIRVARVAVSKAQDRLNYTQGQSNRFRTLFEQKLVARKEFEDTAELATTAAAELKEAKERLNLLMKGTRPEEIDATRAQLEQLEGQRRYIEEQLQLVNVVSPASGIVATPSRQLKEMKRQLVKKGDLIAKVYDFKTVTAQIVIPEKEFAGIEVGYPVVLRARTYPDNVFYGKVTSIATSAQGGSGSSSSGQVAAGTVNASSSANSNKTIIVNTEIDNPTLLLKPEMTGMAKIYCGQRRIVDLVMRRLARTVKVEFWSWW